jgi:hypothetical protein
MSAIMAATMAWYLAESSQHIHQPPPLTVPAAIFYIVCLIGLYGYWRIIQWDIERYERKYNR